MYNNFSYTDTFPDKTPVDKWFTNDSLPCAADLGKQYNISDYGIYDDGNIYTDRLQQLIDTIYDNGGGVLVIPSGTYLSGALFFRQGVNLYIEDGGILKGSDNINDYPVCQTRIEGETCMYFPALINAYGINGFTMCGNGTIDGNGMRSWMSFWKRRCWNPSCTNKDEQRARLVYISNCTNVTVSGLHLCNSQFWTNHLYKCSHVRYLNCRITSPSSPVKAPSTDAIDIDACTDILIKGCTINVNDDAIALKGGKGPFADSDPDNGANERIIIEDCTFEFCHGCLTCGSESIHNRNIIMRHIYVKEGYNLLWLKMRPDTPQLYEYIRLEDVMGKVCNFININPWTQFDNLQGHEIPLSYAEHITMRECICKCDIYYNVLEDPEQYILTDINLTGNDITLTGNDTDKNLHTGAE